MSHPVADYLHERYLVTGVSVPETSGYSSLLLKSADEDYFADA